MAEGHLCGGWTRTWKGEAMRVVVADDSMLLREGLVRLLTEAAGEVVRWSPPSPIWTVSSPQSTSTGRTWRWWARRRPRDHGRGGREALVQHLCQDQSPRPRFGQPPRPRGPHLAQGALTPPHSPICQPLRGLLSSEVRREAAVVSPPRRRSAPGGDGPGAAPPPRGRQRRAVGVPARSAESRRPRDPRAR